MNLAMAVCTWPVVSSTPVLEVGDFKGGGPQSPHFLEDTRRWEVLQPSLEAAALTSCS